MVWSSFFSSENQPLEPKHLFCASASRVFKNETCLCCLTAGTWKPFENKSPWSSNLVESQIPLRICVWSWSNCNLYTTLRCTNHVISGTTDVGSCWIMLDLHIIIWNQTFQNFPQSFNFPTGSRPSPVEPRSPRWPTQVRPSAPAPDWHRQPGRNRLSHGAATQLRWMGWDIWDPQHFSCAMAMFTKARGYWGWHLKVKTLQVRYQFDWICSMISAPELSIQWI
jgi:hypothetical protein